VRKRKRKPRTPRRNPQVLSPHLRGEINWKSKHQYRPMKVIHPEMRAPWEDLPEGSAAPPLTTLSPTLLFSEWDAEIERQRQAHELGQCGLDPDECVWCEGLRDLTGPAPEKPKKTHYPRLPGGAPKHDHAAPLASKLPTLKISRCP
jgi:hypothetical protein